MGRVKPLPRHLQGKAQLPLAGGCFSKGHRLALVALLPVLEARPGDRDDGERVKLSILQNSLLQAGQLPRFVLHEPSLYSWGVFCRGSASDAGVKAAGDLLDQHAFALAISTTIGGGYE
ncbi:hypothetical protein RZQ40_23430 [Enterobacter roggenkampii]|uniref:hypothetical protein n=1 Tax=Enterobacter roggenkampii TaxID=1812935 RepID=UPI00292C9AB8|nr:hypothetical protein [Enterobacter roggenkampii]MDV0471334.1 hypothetical protein [Enterobacter roggenkampii]MDV1259197.1 hypothetical protein [Enterobacter roggenkampii]MDV1329900.1 hypothetical protein [Enterobacter roggenkampii]MDV1359627.1 hypothetical protein [Enterobacter roggenkampii]